MNGFATQASSNSPLKTLSFCAIAVSAPLMSSAALNVTFEETGASTTRVTFEGTSPFSILNEFVETNSSFSPLFSFTMSGTTYQHPPAFGYIAEPVPWDGIFLVPTSNTGSAGFRYNFDAGGGNHTLIFYNATPINDGDAFSGGTVTLDSSLADLNIIPGSSGVWISEDVTGVPVVTWSTVPEPSTYAAIASALAFAYVTYRRRNSRSAK
ncbi:MAG: PEP-CTERM sorting domain-containing protein [Puniceicoccales bacterium]